MCKSKIEFPLSLPFWDHALLSASPQVPAWLSGILLPFLQHIHSFHEMECVPDVASQALSRVIAPRDPLAG